MKPLHATFLYSGSGILSFRVHDEELHKDIMAGSEPVRHGEEQIQIGRLLERWETASKRKVNYEIIT